MKTSISFLKSNVTREETIKMLENTDTEYIHVDIMDGEFVPRRVLEIDEVLELFSNSNKELDIHLMVSHPLEYINKLSVLKPKYLTIHIEIEDDIRSLLNLIKSYGIECGLAINPETDIAELNDYLNEISYIIVMGVHPGEGGQKLIPETVQKIDDLKVLKEAFNYKYDICIDGGVNLETRPLLDNLDVIVSGSYVCLSDDYQSKIDSLR